MPYMISSQSVTNGISLSVSKSKLVYTKQQFDVWCSHRYLKMKMSLHRNLIIHHHNHHRHF